jgi:sensor histidine kinase YesM
MFNTFAVISSRKITIYCLITTLLIACTITLTNSDAIFWRTLFLTSSIIIGSLLPFAIIAPKLAKKFGLMASFIYSTPLCSLLGSVLTFFSLSHNLSFIIIFLAIFGILGSSALIIYFASQYGQKVLSEKKHKIQLSKAKLQTKFAEMQALQAQINPHFLFNTLASIQAFISTEPKLAQQLLSDYTELLKSNMKISTMTLWPLKDELALIKQYSAIQNLRFPDVSLYVQVNESCKSSLLPPLLIQPLVENAFQHGLVPQGNKGKITVQIGKDKNQLIIEVIDSGVGLNHNNKISGNNLALTNITERLETLYNTQGHFYIFNNTPNPGATSRIEIPLQFPN